MSILLMLLLLSLLLLLFLLLISVAYVVDDGDVAIIIGVVCEIE